MKKKNRVPDLGGERDTPFLTTQWHIQDFPDGGKLMPGCEHTIWPIFSQKLHRNEEI